MKITATKNELLGPLSRVNAVANAKSTMPILANVLLTVADGRLSMMCSDLELELVSSIPCNGDIGAVTVPARKLFDVVKVMADLPLTMTTDGDRLIVKCGRSRHSLVTLPAAEFPASIDSTYTHNVTVPAAELKALIERTDFAMAAMDVRFYLNGMLIEIRSDGIRCAATDGYRMAYSGASGELVHSVIVPRKGILELAKMLDSGDAVMSISRNHIRIACGSNVAVSKLIDGRFPDYERMAVRPDTVAKCSRADLIDGLRRVTVLANEKFRGVRVDIGSGAIKLTGANQATDESVEVIDAETPGSLAAAWKVDYLIEALSALTGDAVEFCATEQMAYLADGHSVHVVACLRL